MKNLDSVLKSRDITLPKKVWILKAMAFQSWCTDVRVGHKKDWALKNWFCQTVVLKTLESPLDCKEIQPVHPKGNQSWFFIGRTDAEVEATILWLPDVKSWLIGKDPDAGKDWGQEEKGTTEGEVVGWHHGLMVMNLTKLQKMVKDREAWCAAVHGVAKGQIRHKLETEQQISIIPLCKGKITKFKLLPEKRVHHWQEQATAGLLPAVVQSLSPHAWGLIDCCVPNLVRQDQKDSKLCSCGRTLQLDTPIPEFHYSQAGDGFPWQPSWWRIRLPCRRPWFGSWPGKIPWRRDRLPTPVFLGCPCGSAGKESACNVGDLGSIPGLGRFPWRRERLPTPVFWPGEFYGLYRPWGGNVSDTTEQPFTLGGWKKSHVHSWSVGMCAKDRKLLNQWRWWIKGFNRWRWSRLLETSVSFL